MLSANGMRQPHGMRVPADHKWFARVVIGSAIVRALDQLNLQFPRVDKASLEEFKEVRSTGERRKGRGKESGADCKAGGGGEKAASSRRRPSRFRFWRRAVETFLAVQQKDRPKAVSLQR